MHTVKHLLEKKGKQVWTIGPQASVFEALQLIDRHDLGALVVMEGETIIGLFTERDYARKVILAGRSSRSMTVSELMTTKVLYISPDDTLDDCMALMTEHRTRYLPVLEDGKLAGIISIGDAVKAVISDREFTIRELERYITGGHSSSRRTM